MTHPALEAEGNRPYETMKAGEIAQPFSRLRMPIQEMMVAKLKAAAAADAKKKAEKEKACQLAKEELVSIAFTNDRALAKLIADYPKEMGAAMKKGYAPAIQIAALFTSGIEKRNKAINDFLNLYVAALDNGKDKKVIPEQIDQCDEVITKLKFADLVKDEKVVQKDYDKAVAASSLDIKNLPRFEGSTKNYSKDKKKDVANISELFDDYKNKLAKAPQGKEVETLTKEYGYTFATEAEVQTVRDKLRIAIQLADEKDKDKAVIAGLLRVYHRFELHFSKALIIVQGCIGGQFPCIDSIIKLPVKVAEEMKK